MTKKELVCIQCPLGCLLEVEMKGDEVLSVTGNTCKRGEIYGKKEVVNPTRTVCSSIRVSGGSEPRVSVKTSKDIPKDMIFPCMEVIRSLHIKAPVYIGQVVVHQVCGSDADIVITRNVE